mgnify:CR=1 FL=1
MIKKTLSIINSTPKCVVRPTKHTTLDERINRFLLNFWTKRAQNSKNFKPWYDQNVSNFLNEPQGSNIVKQQIMLNGYSIVENFLDDDDYQKFLGECSKFPEKLSKAKKYGDGVSASYYNLSDEQLLGFKTKIKAVFEEVWGFKHKGEVRGSIQFLTKLKDKVDENDPNTKLHIDRYLPAVKMFYFPYEVDTKSSPFGFIPKSHILDENYLSNVSKNFYTVLKNKGTAFALDSFSKSEELPIIVKGNTLLVAATHGMHRRIPFKSPINQENKRISVRFLFYDEICKSRLLF